MGYWVTAWDFKKVSQTYLFLTTFKVINYYFLKHSVRFFLKKNTHMHVSGTPLFDCVICKFVRNLFASGIWKGERWESRKSILPFHCIFF